MSAGEEGISADILESEMAAVKAEETAGSAAGGGGLFEEEAPKELEIIPVQGSTRECTFILRNEDHTLGNALRSTLMHHPGVSFAGYSVPHPLTREIHLRIVTVSDDCSPSDCLAESLQELSNSAELIMRQFNAALDEYSAGDAPNRAEAAEAVASYGMLDIKVELKQE